MKKRIILFICLNLLLSFFCVLWTENLIDVKQLTPIRQEIILSSEYREQKINEELLPYLEKDAGTKVALYLLESNYGYETWNYDFDKALKKRKQQEGYDAFAETTKSIWNDVKCFPIPEFTNKKNLTVSYNNTWMAERTYGGKRNHEGIDLIASKNQRGLYPVLTVTKKGWLEKGGYRIGITTEKGAYFYYAHLESYSSVEIGDKVKAGDILGFMGDSGYGEEGTVGQFAVHLHLGIYIYVDEKEISVNPYWVLRYIEKNKVKCYTEI